MEGLVVGVAICWSAVVSYQDEVWHLNVGPWVALAAVFLLSQIVELMKSNDAQGKHNGFAVLYVRRDAGWGLGVCSTAIPLVLFAKMLMLSPIPTIVGTSSIRYRTHLCIYLRGGA